MLLCALSDVMPMQAPAPTGRKLLSRRGPAVFDQMASRKTKAAGCSCDACHGQVARPTANVSHDIVSLLTCRAANMEGSCGDDFCETSCKVHISSEPDAKPKCREKASIGEGLSLAQMREVTRLRTSCPPPQACSCACICPEILYPPQLPLPFLLPTPQPVFSGGASLLQVGTETQEHMAVSAAAAAQAALQKASAASISAVAASEAALQKSAAQNSIIKQTWTFPHHEEMSEEERYRQHRRWLQGGGNSDPSKGLAVEHPQEPTKAEDTAMVEVDYSFHQAQTYEVVPKRPVAAVLQTHESAATASLSTQQGNPMPYNMLPPPPGPPAAPVFVNRHDFRPGFNVCPAHSPCNCYCHCKAPPDGKYMNWKPTHDQPIFEG